jgi:aryl-alcohol dehydrogenase-like predicted oxidoreductase
MGKQTRREFTKAAAGAGLALGGMGGLAAWLLRGDEVRSPPIDVERRRLGNTDMMVSVLGFGSAEIGSQNTELRVVRRLLNAVLDTGVNVIDTAASYWGSEEAIGRTIRSRRDEYFLFTKAGHVVDDEIAWYRGFTPTEITRGIERSLRLLKTDRVDVVHLHSCDLETLKRGEAIEALERAKAAGKTRYIGYSGDNEAALWAVESGRFDTLMTSVNIADQRSIDTILPIASQRGMGVLAKRSLANVAWIYDSADKAPPPVTNLYWERLRDLDYDFLRGEAKTKQGTGGPADPALRFPPPPREVHSAIVGTSNPDRPRQNASLLQAGPLPEDLVASIRERWATVAPADWAGIE